MLDQDGDDNGNKNGYSEGQQSNLSSPSPFTSFSRRYGNYIREKQEVDSMIASQYSEDTATNTNTND